MTRFPYEERLLRARVASYVQQGRHAFAIAHLEAFRNRLRRDVNASLTPETMAWIAAKLPTAAAEVAATKVQPSSPNVIGLPCVVMLPPEVDRGGATGTLALCRQRTFSMFAPFTARQISGMDSEGQAAKLGADYFVSTEVMGGHRLRFSLVHLETRNFLISDVVDLAGWAVAGEELANTIAAAVSQHIAILELPNYAPAHR
ncbi:MAG: hypothetical protein JWP26_3825 [Devosia sp.]|uniref:hypothetical protein n=1 Tax=Devosia sp. TaxID=1871048 RepID=UPI002623B91E|nr:hypothetical protein [Devosia sp.]MDB5203926.1 hypothetical protein [Ferruginibacter sp.]MDB5588855.1 hypothetical protein [Devosia sp.]